MTISGEKFNVYLGQVTHAHHLIVVEIGLLDNAIFYRDALRQCQAQTIDDAALSLRDHIVRLDCNAAVEGAPEIMNLDLSAGWVDGNFRYTCEQSIRVVDEGKAESTTGSW